MSAAKGDSSEGEGGARSWAVLHGDCVRKYSLGQKTLYAVNKYLIDPSRKQTKVRILP